MAQRKAPLHVLRGILRLSKTPPLPPELLRKGAVAETFPNALQRFVLQRYRLHRTEASDAKQALLRQTALNYLEMKQDLVERGRLYKLDTGAEVQLSGTEMSRRAAARAGLQLPLLNPELE